MLILRSLDLATTPLFLIVIVLFSSPKSASTQDCTHPDYDALMALLNATNGDHWIDNSGWGENCDVCQWFGILCNSNGRVRVIQLSNNNLDGEIPFDISGLSALETLDLSGNQISGAFPLQVTALTGLKVLNLGNNNITGSIPSEIGSLTALTRLKLRSNLLDGSLPVEIGDLINLVEISLEYNAISGSLPVSLGNLQNLTNFNLTSNEISGQIPPELGDLINAAFISLPLNNLSGEIPKELAGLQSIRFLDLSNNLLTGQLPSELGVLFEAGSSNNFSVSNNGLEGCVPTSYSAFCSKNVNFMYHSNPCFYQGSFTEFCNGGSCSFNDYAISASSSSICNGDPSTISTTGGVNFYWSTGETSPSISVDPLFSAYLFPSGYLVLRNVDNHFRMSKSRLNFYRSPGKSGCLYFWYRCRHSGWF